MAGLTPEEETVLADFEVGLNRATDLRREALRTLCNGPETSITNALLAIGEQLDALGTAVVALIRLDAL